MSKTSLSVQETEIEESYTPPTDEEVAAYSKRLREKRVQVSRLNQFELANPDPRFCYHFEAVGIRGSEDVEAQRLAEGWIKASDYEVGGKEGVKRARMPAKHAAHEFVCYKIPKDYIEEDRKKQKFLADEKLRAASVDSHGTVNSHVNMNQGSVPIHMIKQ